MTVQGPSIKGCHVVKGGGGIIKNNYLFVFNSCVILGKPWVLTGSLADSINYTQNSHKNLAIEVMKILMQITSEMYMCNKMETHLMDLWR